MDNYALAKQYLKWFLITSALLTGIMLLGLLSGCKDVVWAQDVDLSIKINLNIISFIESSNNPLAYNKKSGACGMYQIVPQTCLKEYNILNPSKKMAKQALFVPNKAIVVAGWYMNKRIPSLLKYYHLPDTTENRLRAYNSGIGTLVKGKYPDETRNYVKKYAELAKGEK